MTGTTKTAETAIRRYTADGRAVGPFGVLLVVVGLSIAAGPVGVVAAALLGIRRLVPPVYTVATGFVLATATVPEGFTGVEFAPIGAGLVLVLVATALDERRPRSIVSHFVASLSGLAVVGGGWYLWYGTVSGAAMALLVALSVGLYGTYRYALVQSEAGEVAP